MRYRINWTDRVGFYAEVEAVGPEEAVEIFKANLSLFTPEPCGWAETEIGSLEVYGEPECGPVLTEDDTADTLMRRMLSLWPSAELGEDQDGQLVIYTGMRHSEDGARVVPMEDGGSTEE